MAKCYVWSVGLYGAETWTLKEEMCIRDRLKSDQVTNYKL